MRYIQQMTLAAALCAATVSARAELQVRPGGMVYDTTQNITWLSDFNVNRTTLGREAAIDWAANLVFGGFDDWRLPTANTTASSNCNYVFPDGSYGGFNCTGSEMGHLFYVDIGAQAGNDVASGSNQANLALFSNMMITHYWTGTEFSPGPFGGTWIFQFNDGVQNIGPNGNGFYAVAVRNGDVAAAVPEPQTCALMLAGLGAVVAAVRRRRPS